MGLFKGAFQSTLPCGSDTKRSNSVTTILFQSTLPCGSDCSRGLGLRCGTYFNPRSLAGATTARYILKKTTGISIHAPLRERLLSLSLRLIMTLFQSTLPCGSDYYFQRTYYDYSKHFNPRSLAGATAQLIRCYWMVTFQSTLPCGSDCF